MDWGDGCWGGGRGWHDGFVVMKTEKQNREVFTRGAEDRSHCRMKGKVSPGKVFRGAPVYGLICFIFCLFQLSALVMFSRFFDLKLLRAVRGRAGRRFETFASVLYVGRMD